MLARTVRRIVRVCRIAYFFHFIVDVSWHSTILQAINALECLRALTAQTHCVGLSEFILSFKCGFECAFDCVRGTS